MNDEVALFAATWRLTGLDDGSGESVRPPTGCHAIRFRHTRLHVHGGEERGVPAVSAGDNCGNHALVVIDGDRIRFRRWVNDLVGGYSAAPVSHRPGTPTGPLTVEERRFVSSILEGTATWSLEDDTLTLRKPQTGSLIFVADRAP